MELSLVSLLGVNLVSIIFTHLSLWRFRRAVSIVLSLLVVVSSIWLVHEAGNRLWVVAVAVISVYQVFTLFRVGFSKIQQDNLIQISRKTTVRLWWLQVLIIAVGVLLTNIQVINNNRYVLLALIQIIIAGTLFSSTVRHRAVTRRIQMSTPLIDSEAPTLTVAIPARNETDDLYECLVSLLQCDYPKLEILVLDDQSTVRRTPEIIRSFAHDGVEFVAGKAVPSRWVAKNWAYQQLLEAANGDVILFCGADTRFDKNSLKFLVASLIKRNKTMVSIVPKNTMPLALSERLLQPLRYSWEICLPRRYFRRPPVLSTCWLAHREFLTSNGGFKSIKHRIVCVSYFARLALKNDGYSFFQYDGVASAKKPEDQMETVLRMRYPQLHRQPELVASIMLLEVAGMLGALIVCFSSLVVGSWLTALLSGVALILYCLTFGMVSDITYRRKSLGGYLVWPAICLLDLYLLHLSMWRYEFGTVLWKGRSVTAPVMHHG